MRVLRIITRLNIGGPSKQVSVLSKLSLNNKVEQLLVFGQVLTDEKEIDLSGLGKTLKVDSLGRKVNLIRDFRTLIRLIKIIRKFKPDIIHVHLSKAWLVTVVAKFLAGDKSKLVYTFHGLILDSYFSKRVNWILSYIQKILASKTDKLITVNAENKKELLSKGIGHPDKFAIIYPGFDDRFNLDIKSPKSKFGIDDSVFTIGYVGRFEKIKRPDFLVAVVKYISNEFSSKKIQFIFCGGGSLYETVKRELAGYAVIFLPWTSDLSQVYSVIDLMILTSDNEGSPLTVIETGKLGIPTLARPVGGVSDLIEDKVTGYLCAGEPKDFAWRVSAIVSNPEQHSQVSARARDEFGLKYSETKFLDSHKVLYKSLLDHPGA